LGVVLERLGDKSGALKAFKKALELDPTLEETSKSVSRLE
jgi:Flp pilus assembly protein TadD